jgi:uncharacterized protein YdhG (YjbR/CyaY superfamily)
MSTDDPAVTQAIAEAPEPARTRLEHYRQRAVTLVPDATEGTSYGMPALRYRGRPLIAVIPTRSGYSVYPFSPAVVDLAAPLAPDARRTKGGMGFTEAAPLPDAAFDALVTGRRDEIDAALDS